MIPLRIAFDMDGTLADLSSAYAETEARLFGKPTNEHEPPAPEAREAEQHDEEGVPVSATTGDNQRVVERRRSSARRVTAIAISYGTRSRRRRTSGRR